MQLNMKNVRSIKRGHLPIDGITLIAGENGAGKTSIVHSLAAVLGGIRQPVGKTHAETQAGMIGRDGDKAWAEIEIDGASRRIVWQRKSNTAIAMTEDGERKARLPQCSMIGLGLWRFARAPMNERAERLCDICGLDPTKKDLALEIEDKALALDAGEVWALIQKSGWDGAANDADKQARTLKGRWQEASGRPKWGAKIAADFQPEAYREDDTAEALDVALAEWTGRRDRLVAGNAVDAARKAELEKAIADGAKADAAFEEAETNRLALFDELAALQDERDSLKAKDHALECPHCAKAVVMAGGKLTKAEALTDADRARIEELNEEMKEVDGRLTVAADRAARIKSAQEAAKRAHIEIDGASEPVAEIDGFDADRIAQEIAGIQARKATMIAKTRADELHAQITRQIQIKEICAPDGLRQTKLASKLDEINDTLREAGEALGVGAIRILDDMRVVAGLYTYDALSESEQWRVDLALQIEFAKHARDPLIVVDRLDILSVHNRTAAVKAMQEAGRPVVVLMTIGKRKGAWEGVPDLRQAGMGTTYLLIDGELQPFGAAADAGKVAA